MTTFAAQRLIDNSARFNPDELAAGITYNGQPIPAFIEYGEERARGTSHDAVLDGMTIIIRRADAAVTAKGTPVIVNGESWQVWAAVGGNGLNIKLRLIANAAPMPRRSL